MSVLKKHAKNAEYCNKVATARITENEYELFKSHCEKYKCSISEGLRLLIRSEVGLDK